MSTIWAKKFDGVDARRLPEATDGNALIRGRDGRITRGGEFAKRAAFVPTYDLPEGTVSLAATASGLYVFGSAATPAGMPDDVAYQRLQNGAETLNRVVSWDLFEGQIYAAAEFSSGDISHFYNGVTVGRGGVAARTIVVVGLSGSGGSTVDIQVAGVSATGGPVAWAGSGAATAGALISAINSHTSSPDYTAEALTSLSFFLRAAVVGTAANGRTVTPVTTGSMDVNATPLANGVNKYNVSTRYVHTIGTKEYTLSGPDLQFSAIGDPADWDGGDDGSGGTGFGFIDTSSYTSGSEELTAVVEYRDAAAVFSKRTVQIWNLDEDPANNRLLQVRRNTGTSCPRSIAQFGDQDVFYLDESGLRTLNARDASNSSTTSSIGVRIDPLITAKLRSLTDAERENVIGLVEPVTGNFWLIVKDTIFVYSYFLEEGVRAWTTYSTHYFDDSGTKIDFDVGDAVVFDRRVYLRSDDKIFVYGGLATGQETDATEAEAWTGLFG